MTHCHCPPISASPPAHRLHFLLILLKQRCSSKKKQTKTNPPKKHQKTPTQPKKSKQTPKILSFALVWAAGPNKSSHSRNGLCAYVVPRRCPGYFCQEHRLLVGLLDFHCDLSDNLAARHHGIFQTILEKAENLPAAHTHNGILKEGADNAHFNLFTSISLHQRGIKKLK